LCVMFVVLYAAAKTRKTLSCWLTPVLINTKKYTSAHICTAGCA
jgi:hypothetical protein